MATYDRASRQIRPGILASHIDSMAAEADKLILQVDNRPIPWVLNRARRFEYHSPRTSTTQSPYIAFVGGSIANAGHQDHGQVWKTRGQIYGSRMGTKKEARRNLVGRGDRKIRNFSRARGTFLCRIIRSLYGCTPPFCY